MKPLSVILAALALASCASYHQVYVNSSGELRDCAAFGQGLVGMAGANTITADCGDAMRSVGFIEIERAGIIGVQFTRNEHDSAVVLRVTPGSPADRAGLRPRDQIVMVDSTPVFNAADARTLLFGLAGAPVRVAVLRHSQRVEVTVKRDSYRRIAAAH